MTDPIAARIDRYLADSQRLADEHTSAQTALEAAFKADIAALVKGLPLPEFLFGQTGQPSGALMPQVRELELPTPDKVMDMTPEELSVLERAWNERPLNIKDFRHV